MPNRPASLLLLACAAIFQSLLPAHAAEFRVKNLTLAAIPESIPAVKPDGQITNAERPGFRVEILRNAGKQCGVSVDFRPVPWERALAMVEGGTVSGAFSASYTPQRAAFGAFPLKNGAPDPSKAMKGYAYSLYARDGSTLSWDGTTVSGNDRQVLVERGSVGVEMAKKLKLEPAEASDYQKMFRMLAAKRYQGMLAIESNADKILMENPAEAKNIRKLSPVVEAKHGYVMFAKAFYEANTEMVECFWKRLGEIRAQPAYEELVKSYNKGVFID